jgi:hypothetical protein
MASRPSSRPQSQPAEHERMLEDIETADFVTTINVLRRVVANLGGKNDLS